MHRNFQKIQVPTGGLLPPQAPPVAPPLGGLFCPPIKIVLSNSPTTIGLKTIFRLHKARVCPTGFGATFAAIFVLIYRLRQFPLSAVNNRLELRCQLKQLLLSYLQNLLLFALSILNSAHGNKNFARFLLFSHWTFSGMYFCRIP